MKRRDFLGSIGSAFGLAALGGSTVSRAFAATDFVELPFANGRRPRRHRQGEAPGLADR